MGEHSPNVYGVECFQRSSKVEGGDGREEGVGGPAKVQADLDLARVLGGNVVGRPRRSGKMMPNWIRNWKEEGEGTGSGEGRGNGDGLKGEEESEPVGAAQLLLELSGEHHLLGEERRMGHEGGSEVEGMECSVVEEVLAQEEERVAVELEAVAEHELAAHRSEDEGGEGPEGSPL